ncbi:hypothetical protein, partial [Bradyrhizobium nitroreducens]|uniref:hypothetical protein n=1 Tax=Bradyrhizobium nitroreducens TaxID=709803 RepID=UPI001AEFCDA7
QARNRATEVVSKGIPDPLSRAGGDLSDMTRPQQARALRFGFSVFSEHREDWVCRRRDFDPASRQFVQLQLR